MFLPSRGTSYDLRFPLLGIPVTVSPFFWVTAAILGFHWIYADPGGPVNLVVWVACVFVSLIIHEFGHALTMRAFGHRPEVVLFHFGGYATYRGSETPGRSLLISAAGPAVQLALFAAIAVGIGLWLGLGSQVAIFFLPQNLIAVPVFLADAMAGVGVFAVNTPLFVLVYSMLWINILWPLFNLFPILPLDGGRILHEILELSHVRRAEMWALRVGVVAGILAAVYFLIFSGGRSFLIGAMFAFMAMTNYQALKGDPSERWG